MGHLVDDIECTTTFHAFWCFYCPVLSILVIAIMNRPRMQRAEVT